VKKARFSFIILAVAMMVLALASLNVGTVRAASSQEYTIDRVDHRIEVLYDGSVFITDTITVTGRSAQDDAVVGSFLMGFPYKYGQHVLRYLAYNATNSFQVTPNVPLEGHMGYYAVEIAFPQPLSAKNGTSHVFTAGFVLSNNLIGKQDVQNTSRYTLDFPAFPSLTKTASFCNVSIVLPSGAAYVSGTVTGFVYSRENLVPFTYAPETVTFTVAGSRIMVVDVTELKREIIVNGIGELSGSDTYRITNKAQLELHFVEVILPPNASNVDAQDQFGRRMTKPALSDEKTSRYNVTLLDFVEIGNSTIFKLSYSLPNAVYVAEQQDATDSFILTFPTFSNLNYHIGKTTTAFVLPEGARLQSFNRTSDGHAYSLTRDVFQEALGITGQDVISLDSFSIRILYSYNTMWLAFRPALWMWALGLLASVVAVAWKRPKTKAQAVTSAAVGGRLQPEYLRSFADAYEEKLKIMAELGSIESKVEKGKIPRRRYKVQKKTLEIRLGTLDRTLDEYKTRMRAAGGHYSELMLQLEIAESELREVNNGLKSDEVRHNQGELSLEAFKKRQDDYQKRKGNAESDINGILFRFREETR